MSPKGDKQQRQFPLVSRVCLLSAQSRFRRKRKLQPLSNPKNICLSGQLKKARVRESLGLIENISFNITFQIAHALAQGTTCPQLAQEPPMFLPTH
jgi:hypothetical protein